MSAAVAGLGAAVFVVAVVALLGGRALRPRIARRDVRPSARPRSRRWWWPAAAAFGVVALAGPLATAAAAAAVTFGLWWSVRRARLRRAAEIERAYPDAIDLVVLAIRAGLLPPAALGAAAAHLPAVVGASFASVIERMATGERFADALGTLTDELGDIARPMVDSLAAADRYGLPIAPVLDRLSAEARADRRRTAEAAARQLPVRLAVPLVICTLPSFVLLAIVPLLIGAFSSWRLP